MMMARVKAKAVARKERARREKGKAKAKGRGKERGKRATRQPTAQARVPKNPMMTRESTKTEKIMEKMENTMAQRRRRMQRLRNSLLWTVMCLTSSWRNRVRAKTKK